MAIRISKRLLRLGGLLVCLLGLFGLLLHKSEKGALLQIQEAKTQMNDWAADKFKDWNPGKSSEKKQEEQRKEAEMAAEGGEHYEDLTWTDEAKKLLADSEKSSLSEVAVSSTASTSTLAATGGAAAKASSKEEPIKACFVSLVRNEDLWKLADTIKNVQDRFNDKFNYPWVFLNNEVFTEEFKHVIGGIVSGPAKFEVIPPAYWSYPDWIDQEKAAQTRIAMKDIIYGDSESYRHMCRFESGFFWRHEALDEFDWYWRVEPETKLHCDIDYDVFKWMRDNDKKYGFTISIYEYEATIKTLWSTTQEFLKLHPEHVAEDNMMDFISKDNGKKYNLCHFWSNFEVASLDLWRSKAYRDYFDYLDQAGGFFYERWGDAPVHSIAAALFLPRDQIHYFPDIGYYHPPYNNCPLDQDIFDKGKCTCNQDADFTFQGYSCTSRFFEVNKMKKPQGWEKFKG
ncbi:LAQU0S16e01464g1_1 [Lachancea quebecensis]|uniref:LAQU0S16e01464g1_1 n=1 Tax=Lachancea quebecensis TaxID=1654605 RepID=A0A0P1KWU0_9SACH|nr:LAQU0S16e01464g1_1 [Lachancea quebecensis]